MHVLLISLLLLALLFGPQLWVQHVLRKNNVRDEDFPGTGGELANHLLERFNIGSVKVEPTPEGDHYDPLSRTVRLTPDKLEGKTLTAIVTAAHEVGHAIQDAEGDRAFRWRTRLAIAAAGAQKLASFLLFLSPVLMLLTRHPIPSAVTVGLAVASVFVGFVLQLITLPVELDASFGKAMPILSSGYLRPGQQKEAKRILRACALTYVAGSLAGLLNFWRWMRVIGR